MIQISIECKKFCPRHQENVCDRIQHVWYLYFRGFIKNFNVDKYNSIPNTRIDR